MGRTTFRSCVTESTCVWLLTLWWVADPLWKLHFLLSFSDRSPDVDNDSDEDEVHDYNEFSSNDEMSDSEPVMMDEHHRPRKTSRIKTRPVTATTRVCNSGASLPCYPSKSHCQNTDRLRMTDTQNSITQFKWNHAHLYTGVCGAENVSLLMLLDRSIFFFNIHTSSSLILLCSCTLRIM